MTKTDPETPIVDEGEIRRKSMKDGMFSGLKNGLKWGGIGTGVIGLGLGALTMALGTKAAGLLLSNIYTAIITVAVGASTGPVGIATAALGSILSTTLSIGIPLIAAAMVIGGVIGAINGYQSADEKVAMAEKQAQRDIRMAQIEQQKSQQYQQQLDGKMQQYQQQSQELMAGNSQIGQFQPGATPNIANGTMDGPAQPQGGYRDA